MRQIQSLSIFFMLAVFVTTESISVGMREPKYFARHLSPASQPSESLRQAEELRIQIRFARKIMHDLNNFATGLNMVEMIDFYAREAQTPIPKEVRQIHRLRKEFMEELEAAHLWLKSVAAIPAEAPWEAELTLAWNRVHNAARIAELIRQKTKRIQRDEIPYVRNPENLIRGINLGYEKTQKGLAALALALEGMRHKTYVEQREVESFLRRYFSSFQALLKSESFNFEFLMVEMALLPDQPPDYRYSTEGFLSKLLQILDRLNKTEKKPVVVKVKVTQSPDLIKIELNGSYTVTLPLLSPSPEQNRFRRPSWEMVLDSLSPVEETYLSQVIIPTALKVETGKNNVGVLLVDDERILLNLWSRLLEMKGYRILGKTQTSKEAWDLFQEIKDPRLIVLTDFSLPGENGLEMAKKMMALSRQRQQRTLVAVITGNTINLEGGKKIILDDQKKPHDASFVHDLIAKPFDLKDFIDRVGELKELIEVLPISEPDAFPGEWAL